MMTVMFSKLKCLRFCWYKLPSFVTKKHKIVSNKTGYPREVLRYKFVFILVYFPSKKHVLYISNKNNCFQ
jgi:hypothetical protein